jgi:4-oxalocrotonate tautomerase
MPIIRVEMFAGRSREQKRAIAAALTEAFVASGGSTPAGVTVLFTDVEKEDWAVGGVLAADRDKG